MKSFDGTFKVVLVMEYYGVRYHGFQWQQNLPTIQGELEKAIYRLTGEERRVISASRTDAGVHARGQIVSFWTKYSLPPRSWVRALNYYLPEDIAVREAYQIAGDFNIRREALSREYSYYILNRSPRSPFIRGLAHQVLKPLDIEAMRAACVVLEGTHDFISFATMLGQVSSTVRTVYRADVKSRGQWVIFNIVADSFLAHQVRNTVGLLTRVGLTKVAVADFRKVMDTRTFGLAGPTAPACGLYLDKVSYRRSFAEMNN